MKKHVGIAAAALSMAVVIVLVVWFSMRPTTSLTQTYHNNAFGFSLRLPGNYTITETTSANPPEENSSAEIIEFSDAQGSIQLTVTPASYVSSPLTVESLLSNYPLIGSETVEPFPIATSTVGLAIDNDPSRSNGISDVWFARAGYLYQLTAFGDGYGELIPVAKTISLQ
jgi:uncharacterized membrane protein